MELVGQAKPLVRSIMGRLADRLMEVGSDLSAFSARDGRMAKYFPELAMAAVREFGLHQPPGNESYLARQVREQASVQAASQQAEAHLSTGVAIAAAVFGATNPFVLPALIAFTVLGLGAAERARHIATLRSAAGTTDASAANAAEVNEDIAWAGAILTAVSIGRGELFDRIGKWVGAEGPSGAAEWVMKAIDALRAASQGYASQRSSRTSRAEAEWKRYVERGQVQ